MGVVAILNTASETSYSLKTDMRREQWESRRGIKNEKFIIDLLRVIKGNQFLWKQRPECEKHRNARMNTHRTRSSRCVVFDSLIKHLKCFETFPFEHDSICLAVLKT